MTKLYDKQGGSVRLGAEIKRGGEGTVYEVEGRSKIVAKIYHQTPSPQKSAKLAAMAALSSERLQRVAAWPLDTLHSSPGSNACGFLMPRINSLREVHELYGPKSRLTHFPNANWAFLNHTASNVARAFSGLHAQNLVIGDVNQSNLLVSEQGIVTLIDCDSFQITHQGKSYLCEVGVPTHTPPELQGKSFSAVTRTANHDNFGLAVVLFQLLFLGRHPFSGQYLGAGDMPIEKAITGFRFAYGSGAAAHQMKPPPATLPFSAASEPVIRLFERAFSEEGANPNSRPRADEWINALTALGQNLTTCTQHTGHQYLSSLRSCPFCQVEAVSGLVLFNITITGNASTTSTFDLALVWQQICAVPHPGPLPAVTVLPAFSPPPPYSAPAPAPSLVEPKNRVAFSANMLVIKRQRTARRWAVTGIVALVGMISAPIGSPFASFYLMLMAFVAVYIVLIMLFNRKAQIQIEAMLKEAHEQYHYEMSARHEEERWQAERARNYMEKRRSMDLALELAEKQYAEAWQQWTRESGSLSFDTRKAELEKFKKQLQNLSEQLQTRLRKMENEREKYQMENHLDHYKLAFATIDGIGQGRKATLQSYGIETAADVSESLVLSIPGFGYSLCNALMAWRRKQEAKFVYNPSLGVDAKDKIILEREFAARRAKLEQELRDGPAMLLSINQQIVSKRNSLRSKLEITAQLVTTARSSYQGLIP